MRLAARMSIIGSFAHDVGTHLYMMYERKVLLGTGECT